MRNISEKFGNYVKDLECQFVAISHDLNITEGEGENIRIIATVPVSGRRPPVLIMQDITEQKFLLRKQITN